MNEILHDGMCGIRIHTKLNLIKNVISVYLPSQGSTESYGARIDDLCKFIDSREIGSKNIVCGDVNGDVGSLRGRKSLREPTYRGKVFYNCIDSYNLVATNLQTWSKGPVETFIGPNGSTTIDYILVPKDIVGKVRECKVMGDEQLNCSDNNPVTINIDIDSLKYQSGIEFLKVIWK